MDTPALDIVLDRIDRRVAPEKRPDRPNHRFFLMHGHEHAQYGRLVPRWARGEDGKLVVDKRGRLQLVGYRTLPYTRRQFIERYVRIRTKDGVIVSLRPNPAQRRLEAEVLKQDRRGLPIRQVILKARQMGFSTWVQGCIFEHTVRHMHSRALVVAHDDDTSREVLQMSHIMKDSVPLEEGEGTYAFGMKHEATNMLGWRAPINSTMKVASAKKKAPGRGFTMNWLQLSEAAFWDDAQSKAKALLQVLPKRPGTAAMMESTANGASGFFHDTFKRAWADRNIPHEHRATVWNACFFAWYEDPEYRWTKSIGRQREIPDELQQWLESTLTDHEKWLLEQSYFERGTEEHECIEVPCGAGGTKWSRQGVGWKRVDYDQLLWRRFQIRDECDGDPLNPETWDSFREEYPAFPDEAFLATGRLAFDASRIHEFQGNAREPVWRGEFGASTAQPEDFDGSAVRPWVDQTGGGIGDRPGMRTSQPTIVIPDRRGVGIPTYRGGWRIWRHPQPGEKFVVGVDTSSGMRTGDAAAACVLETRSRDLCAGYHGRMDPTDFGIACARVGWYFNTAMLAIETHPSQHGLTTAHAALGIGYPELYQREQKAYADRHATKELGWATTPKTRGFLIDAVRLALAHAYDIPWADILEELLNQKYGENNKLESDGPDDLFIAFGIAHEVAGTVAQRGYVSQVEDQGPVSWKDQWWEYRRARLEGRTPQEATPVHRIYDGT